MAQNGSPGIPSHLAPPGRPSRRPPRWAWRRCRCTSPCRQAAETTTNVSERAPHMSTHVAVFHHDAFLQRNQCCHDSPSPLPPPLSLPPSTVYRTGRFSSALLPTPRSPSVLTFGQCSLLPPHHCPGYLPHHASARRGLRGGRCRCQWG